MKIQKNCPICNSKKISRLFLAESFPFFTAPVKKKEKREILGKYNPRQLQDRLESVVCNNCSHIFLSTLAPENIISELYRKFYSYPSALETNFIPERDNAFLRVFKEKIRKEIRKDQKNVLEIGCYDGFILYYLRKLGFSVTGCDPSNGAIIGQKHHINIKRRFFDVEYFLNASLSYDIIIFRHFLEHVATPVDFLKNLPKILRPNGLIIFEVPSTDFHVKNIETSVFSFQHLQYFTEKSIAELMKKTSLKLIKIFDTGENLIIVSSVEVPKTDKDRKRIKKSYKEFKNKFENKKERLNKIIRKYSDKGIVLWGAGGFCVSLIETYDVKKENILLIVDSDAKKWGMEFLNYNIPIVSPSILKECNHGCLIICSMYAKEIMNQLKTLKYDKPVVNLYPKLKLYRAEKYV